MRNPGNHGSGSTTGSKLNGGRPTIHVLCSPCGRASSGKAAAQVALSDQAKAVTRLSATTLQTGKFAQRVGFAVEVEY